MWPTQVSYLSEQFGQSRLDEAGLPGCHSQHTAHYFPIPFHLVLAAVSLSAKGSLRPYLNHPFICKCIPPLASGTASDPPSITMVLLDHYTGPLHPYSLSGGLAVLRAPFILYTFRSQPNHLCCPRASSTARSKPI